MEKQSSLPTAISENSKVVQLLVVPLLFFIGAKLSLAFAVMPDSLVMVWMPNGVLLAALLHYEMRRYAWFVGAVVIAEIAADYPTYSLTEAILFGLMNLAEATAACLLLRRWRFNPAFTQPADLGRFLIAGPVVSAFAAACAAAAMYRHFGGSAMSYLQFLRVWWFSDGLGLMMITPLVLSIWPAGSRVLVERVALRWYDGAVALVAFAFVCALLMSEKAQFLDWPVRPVQLLPFALYGAARLTPRATTIVVTLFAAVVLFMTRNGQQPFGELPVEQTILQVQQFVIIMAITSLGLSSLLSQLRTNARQLELRVQERTAELRAANEQLLRLTVTDALTNLANRRALFDSLQREIIRCKRHPHDLAVIMFDIDHFKAVNDQYGHAAGDRVIRYVADVSSRMIRGTDMLARYGGEEFVIVAPETDAAHALQLAERIRAALGSSVIAVDHHSLRVTSSFGVAILRENDTEAETLLRRADAALYAAKAAGRNRVETGWRSAAQLNCSR